MPVYIFSNEFAVSFNDCVEGVHMHYSAIKTFDIANGVGVRTSLFVSGCRHKCEGCFNSDAWAFDNGKAFNNDVYDYILQTMSMNYVDGLSILGGEPLEPENQHTVLTLMKKVKETYPNKNIWMWTGFTWEELTDPEYESKCRAQTAELDNILKLTDVLVDGPFELENKDITLRFRGSPNQRIIDVPKSLETGEVVLWDDGPILNNHGSF